MQPALISGARVLFTINKAIVACGHVLSYNIRTNHEELRGCDSVVPYELMPTTVSVSMTCQVFRKPDDSAVAMGFAPAAVDENTNQGPFAANRYITVECRDSVTDKTLLFLSRAMIVSRSGSVDAEGLLVETWQILAIGAKENMTSPGIIGSVGALF